VPPSGKRFVMADGAALVLRLAGPLQSWATSSQFNRRGTDDRPSKAGVIGLLAAAEGRRRGDPIADLLGLRLAVRVDQPGSLLRDYHTVSTLDGSPLLSAKVNSKGRQVTTSPRKHTHVTVRYYLQDAVFVGLMQGERELLLGLSESLRRPRFPLALGRRSCVPTQPLVLASPSGDWVWEGELDDLLSSVPWQAGEAARTKRGLGPFVRVAATIDDPGGNDLVADVPITFAPRERGMTTRRVRHRWVELRTGSQSETAEPPAHDPFALLGW